MQCIKSVQPWTEAWSSHKVSLTKQAGKEEPGFQAVTWLTPSPKAQFWGGGST